LTEREVEKLIDAAKGAAFMSAIGVTADKAEFWREMVCPLCPKVDICKC
jgi:hypothetical protein